MNLELILQSFYDTVLMDLNIFITVIPSMFVIKSNAMEKFVSYLPLGKAVIAELNDLSAVLFANLGETSKFNWIILNEDFINIFWSCRPVRTVVSNDCCSSLSCRGFCLGKNSMHFSFT